MDAHRSISRGKVPILTHVDALGGLGDGQQRVADLLGEERARQLEQGEGGESQRSGGGTQTHLLCPTLHQLGDGDAARLGEAVKEVGGRRGSVEMSLEVDGAARGTTDQLPSTTF